MFRSGAREQMQKYFSSWLTLDKVIAPCPQSDIWYQLLHTVRIEIIRYSSISIYNI